MGRKNKKDPVRPHFSVLRRTRRFSFRVWPLSHSSDKACAFERVSLFWKYLASSQWLQRNSEVLWWLPKVYLRLRWSWYQPQWGDRWAINLEPTLFLRLSHLIYYYYYFHHCGWCVTKSMGTHMPQFLCLCLHGGQGQLAGVSALLGYCGTWVRQACAPSPSSHTEPSCWSCHTLNFLFSCVWEFCLLRPEGGVLDSTWTGVIVVRCYVGAGNQTWVPWESSQCS